MVTNNTIGLEQRPGGLLESRGNNTVRGNASDMSGVVTIIPGV